MSSWSQFQLQCDPKACPHHTPSPHPNLSPMPPLVFPEHTETLPATSGLLLSTYLPGSQASFPTSFWKAWSCSQMPNFMEGAGQAEEISCGLSEDITTKSRYFWLLDQEILFPVSTLPSALPLKPSPGKPSLQEPPASTCQ